MNKIRTAQEILEEIDQLCGARDLCLAKQGEQNTAKEITAPDQARDVDYWAPRRCRSAVRASFENLGGYLLCTCTSRNWLNHDVYLFPCVEGNLQIDVTIGDLMVGPVTFADQERVLDSLNHDGRLGGLPLIADLLLRPLARGRRISGRRLEQAVRRWQAMSADERAETRADLANRIGDAPARLCVDVLEGRDRQSSLLLRLRVLTIMRSLSSVGAMKVAARKVRMAITGIVTRRSKPFGRYHRGLLVAIIGTDGVGKSSTIERLAKGLADQRTRAARHYLGRARGNLPGINAVRNLVGRKVRSGGRLTDVYKYSILNKMVTWYYAIEYSLRLARPWFQARFLGRVVLCDRYIYDLELIPNHSGLAARFSRWATPRPDIIVLLQASSGVIRSRKQERDIATIEEHQELFRRILEAGVARGRSVTMQTDALSQEEVSGRLLQMINREIHASFS